MVFGVRRTVVLVSHRDPLGATTSSIHLPCAIRSNRPLGADGEQRASVQCTDATAPTGASATRRFVEAPSSVCSSAPRREGQQHESPLVARFGSEAYAISFLQDCR